MTELRPIYLANLDKIRPVLMLTRQEVIPHLKHVTVALITSRIRGLKVEVEIGRPNGLDHDCVVNCDNVTTIDKDLLLRPIGALLLAQEPVLARALGTAFDVAI
ncbi:MAG TPA: type II toxin-antitoxin system PemK/MazF family toxin [Kineosporiaceae bacterium]|nr:type II toxin-antitoxin system PemK/MazF family toxin [Kineosporiaceae bacterium]